MGNKTKIHLIDECMPKVFILIHTREKKLNLNYV